MRRNSSDCSSLGTNGSTGTPRSSANSTPRPQSQRPQDPTSTRASRPRRTCRSHSRAKKNRVSFSFKLDVVLYGPMPVVLASHPQSTAATTTCPPIALPRTTSSVSAGATPSPCPHDSGTTTEGGLMSRCKTTTRAPSDGGGRMLLHTRRSSSPSAVVVSRAEANEAIVAQPSYRRTSSPYIVRNSDTDRRSETQTPPPPPTTALERLYGAAAQKETFNPRRDFVATAAGREAQEALSGQCAPKAAIELSWLQRFGGESYGYTSSNETTGTGSTPGGEGTYAIHHKQSTKLWTKHRADRFGYTGAGDESSYPTTTMCDADCGTIGTVSAGTGSTGTLLRHSRQWEGDPPTLMAPVLPEGEASEEGYNNEKEGDSLAHTTSRLIITASPNEPFDSAPTSPLWSSASPCPSPHHVGDYVYCPPPRQRQQSTVSGQPPISSDGPPTKGQKTTPLSTAESFRQSRSIQENRLGVSSDGVDGKRNKPRNKAVWSSDTVRGLLCLAIYELENACVPHYVALPLLQMLLTQSSALQRMMNNTPKYDTSWDAFLAPLLQFARRCLRTEASRGNNRGTAKSRTTPPPSDGRTTGSDTGDDSDSDSEWEYVADSPYRAYRTYDQLVEERQQQPISSRQRFLRVDEMALHCVAVLMRDVRVGAVSSLFKVFMADVVEDLERNPWPEYFLFSVNGSRGLSALLFYGLTAHCRSIKQTIRCLSLVHGTLATHCGDANIKTQHANPSTRSALASTALNPRQRHLLFDYMLARSEEGDNAQDALTNLLVLFVYLVAFIEDTLGEHFYIRPANTTTRTGLAAPTASAIFGGVQYGSDGETTDFFLDDDSSPARTAPTTESSRYMSEPQVVDVIGVAVDVVKALLKKQREKEKKGGSRSNDGGNGDNSTKSAKSLANWGGKLWRHQRFAQWVACTATADGGFGTLFLTNAPLCAWATSTAPPSDCAYSTVNVATQSEGKSVWRKALHSALGGSAAAKELLQCWPSYDIAFTDLS